MVIDPNSEFFRAMRGGGRRRPPEVALDARLRRRGDLLLGAVALMLVLEGLLPFLSPAAGARCSSVRRAERRPDPFHRPEQHAHRLLLLLIYWR
jgi:hypothetical protein